MLYKDYVRVLYIDLTNQTIRIDNNKELHKYLGGVGIASKLLEENIKPDKQILDGSQCAVFAIGAVSTIYPVVTKTVAMFWSPLTGELGESYAGGRMAMTMFMAGYDAVVITGKSRKPIYLTISNNDVEFRDASALWGISNDDTGRIIREKEAGAGKRSIIRIGKAGENLINYASVCVDTYRHFGRMGLGAVLGSKNLKAISIFGKGSTPVKEMKDYFKVYQNIYKQVTSTDIMSKYHDLGTAIGVHVLNEKGGLPLYNLSKSKDEDVESVSGEKFAEDNLVRKTACVGCPVGCIHIGQFRREFDKGFEYEAVSVSYDYELIFSLGTFLGIKDSNRILELIEIVENAGMDAISTGVCLGWATEAYNNSLITTADTIVPLEFGNHQSYLKAIEYIAERKNKFYSTLGEGVARASEIYGGQEYAMHFSKNEMAGYHTGYGSVLGSAVGARHSHLCNGGYSFDQGTKLTPEQIVDKIFEEEKERCVLNSLIICLFARKVYSRQVVLEALNAVGYNYSEEDLIKLGEEIYKTKLRIKKMVGFNQLEVKLPKRFFDTAALGEKLDEKVTYELIKKYNDKIEALLKA